jgi:hypothetical protein
LLIICRNKGPNGPTFKNIHEESSDLKPSIIKNYFQSIGKSSTGHFLIKRLFDRFRLDCLE